MSGAQDRHRPRKRFGQNFLHDRGIIERIVSAIGPRRDDHLVEIGPGEGALTEPLFECLDELDVIELDRDLCGRLHQRFGERPGFRLHEGDALQFNFADLCPAERPSRLRVVGNLPYNISTPLIFHLLSQRESIADMHFMLQQEVVERLTAVPGTKAYGRLGIMVQLDCKAELLFKVGPGAFRPPPKVTSAVVRLTLRDSPAIEVIDRKVLAELLRHVFSQRRKTLRAILKGRLTQDELTGLDIDPGARPGTLKIEEFGRLADTLASR